MPKDSPIKSLQDLKGKKVVLNKGSNVHYLLVRALEDAGLKYTDIQTVFLPPADARAAFERGSVDAWVIWDPYQAAAEAATGARTLRNGEGIVDNHQFYFASKSFAEAHQDVVDTIFASLGEVDKWVKANPADVAAQFSPALGIPGADPRSRCRSAVLRHQVDRRRCGRQTAEDRRHVFPARPHPEPDQDRRCRAEAAVLSAAEKAERPLVPADAWRRQVPRDGDRRARRRSRLPEADRAGG